MSFRERLRDAQMAAMVSTRTELARRTGMTPERLAAIVAQPERATVTEGIAIARALKVRIFWLWENDGMPSPMTMNGHASEALAVLEAMPAQNRETWIGVGRRLMR